MALTALRVPGSVSGAPDSSVSTLPVSLLPSRLGLPASRTSNATALARRVEVYRRAEEMILEDAPVIPLWHQTYERLFQPYVKGVEVNGLGDSYIPFRKVWLERPR